MNPPPRPSPARGEGVAITGASGYLGGVLLREAASRGWRTIALGRTRSADPPPRTPHPDPPPQGGREKVQARGEGDYWRPYDLVGPVDPAVLRDVDVLVHCAYDMTLKSRARIWEINVDGSERLLAAAKAAGVRRSIVISSIAAFEGTTQLYGQAKLAIEAVARRYGAIIVRPGLTFGPHAGGMVGALRAQMKAGVVPLLAGRSHQYLIHEDDLADAVLCLATISQPPTEPVVVAGAEPVSMADILRTIARADSRPLRMVPLPWRPVYTGLTLSERLGLKLPFRADSLWGLAHPPPPPAAGPLRRLGVVPRRLTVEALSAGAL